LSNKAAGLAIFALALLPRLLAPGDFLTVDEAYHWFERAELFAQAVLAGRFAETNLIGHPGVTTMWLGALGWLLHSALSSAGHIAPDASAPSFYELLRMPLAVANALCVALAFPLLRRLFGLRVAWLAVLLWASEPFIIAHSGIVHVDALLASFMTLSLLAALLAFGADSSSAPAVRWPWLALSGVAGGLALLTKSPAVLLLPMVGLIALSPHPSSRLPSSPHRLLPLLAWGAIAATVWVLLWPAAWVDLAGALERVVLQVAYEGASPHGWGNFFLGRAVADPGPLFYPAALVLRLTPWTLAGVLALGAAVAGRGAAPQGLAAALLLLAFMLLFVGVLSVPPKKFDRYLLPIFPALCILAAAGWVWLLARLPLPGRLEPLAWGALLLAQAATLLWYHPYYLAYYNPLLGGGPAAVRAIPVGWGEGMAQAGAYIRAQHNGCDRPVASWFEPVLEPFVCTPVLRPRVIFEPGRVDYAVLYIDQLQRNNEPRAIERLRGISPVHTVRLHGIDYARIYQLPRPLAQESGAAFGPAIRLHSYEIDTADLRQSGVLTLTTQWQARAPIEQDYLMFAHVLDEQGQRIAQIDVPPGGPDVPTSAWNAGHYVTWYHPLPLRADLPPGTYWLAVGLYDPASAARLPLDNARPPAEAPDDGSGALLLGPVKIR
jgi:hypothetical protein